MEINLVNVKIRDLVKGFVDNGEEGVVGFGGDLDIRPPYQREFVYNEKQQRAVIDSIQKNMPLNVMYWVDNGEDVVGANQYEVLDGQQRIRSICSFVYGDFSVDFQYFTNLTQEEKDQILDYELLVYFCKGNERDKLKWFETINIAGEKLTKQELRNSIYTGPWLANAKRYFSKIGCPAASISSNYVKASTVRQELLEVAISWISKGNIEEYMAQHQHDENAEELWNYFRKVINWVESTFPNPREKLMRSVNWGALYDDFGSNHYDSLALEERINELLQDDDVTKQSGVYYYVLTGSEKFLSIRKFDEKLKRRVYERQGGICVHCGTHHELKGMEADHITPWSQGGKTTIDNCQLLCLNCNRTKSDK